MEGRCGMRKERGESLPFLQEPTLGRAEVLAAQCQCQALAKGQAASCPAPLLCAVTTSAPEHPSC